MVEAMFIMYSSVTSLQTVFQVTPPVPPSISPLHSAGSNVAQGLQVPDDTNIGDTIYSSINEEDEITCLIDSVNDITTPQSADGDSD